MADAVRTWGPAVLVVALLPLAFVGLRACLPPIGRGHPAPVPHDEAAPPPAVGGSAACASCHAEIHAAWGTSTHARAERELVDTDPTPPDDWVPVRALGVTPLVQFLVPFERGRLQVTQAAWDPLAREWFDVFDDGREPGEWGHWTGGAMTWNSQCAACHSTGVVKGYDAATRSYATTLDELGVGCVACHGDASDHLAGGAPPKVASDRWLDVCGSCHARRAELTGRFQPGDAFLDHYAPTLVDLTEAYWPDGQVHQEDFELTAFLGSAMHAAGVQCVQCHDPHTGSLRAPVPDLCEGCHLALPSFQRHDPHPDGGPDCVGCHMPTTVYMQRDPRHDHGLQVPDPSIGLDPGIPDACTRCHADRDPAWALAAYRRWWGEPDPARATRARAVARARAGEPGDVQALLELLGSDRGAWRATAASVLEAYLQEPAVRTALVGALADPDGYVRFAAAGSLAPAGALPEVHAALEASLDDPLRAVRVQASRGVRAGLDPGSERLADYEAYLALNADQPAALHERGSWELERGRTAAAVKTLQAAVDVDATSPILRDSLAVALSAWGRPDDAAVQLREAVALAPDDGELAYRLGLAEAGAGHLDAAEEALERAVTVAPDHTRAWYNLGLLRSQQGHAEAAVTALEHAVATAPTDAEVRYGLASVQFQLGRRDAARQAAEEVLRLDPAHQGARAILAK